ncbi:Leucine rich repeat containing protein BspA family protein [Entamoeba marina]
MKHSHEQLDSYSILICSKYLHGVEDYINLICVNSKFKETTEKLRFNPIPIKSLKLFPKMQTQYLYSPNDTQLNQISFFEKWYIVDYIEHLQSFKNTICHHVKYRNEQMNYKSNYVLNNVNILDDNCFEQNDITTIIIPNSVTSIGNGCFSGCLNLSSITFSSKLTKLSNDCFNDCASLTTLNIPFTLKSIGNYCFYGCEKLHAITIPNSITFIGNNCFNDCSLLQSVTLPNSLHILDHDTFQGCYSLTKIELPTTLVVIGDKCFENCENLTTVTLPSSLKKYWKIWFYRMWTSIN